LLSPDAVSCFRTRCHDFQNESSELLYPMPGQCRHSCRDGYRTASKKMHTGNGRSYLSLRSIASAVPGRHQYADNICQEATGELSTYPKGQESYLPIPVHAGLIEFLLSAIAVPLLSKLGDIQALCLSQIVFRRQLALIIGDIVAGFIFIIRKLSSSGSLVESLSDPLSEKVSVRSELASV